MTWLLKSGGMNKAENVKGLKYIIAHLLIFYNDKGFASFTPTGQRRITNTWYGKSQSQVQSFVRTVTRQKTNMPRSPADRAIFDSI